MKELKTIGLMQVDTKVTKQIYICPKNLKIFELTP
jgi:hypothetical protein